MDQIRWFIYWMGFVPLALGVVIFGAIALMMIAALFAWEWCFEEAQADQTPEHALRSQQASR